MTPWKSNLSSCGRGGLDHRGLSRYSCRAGNGPRDSDRHPGRQDSYALGEGGWPEPAEAKRATEATEEQQHRAVHETVEAAEEHN